MKFNLMEKIFNKKAHEQQIDKLKVILGRKADKLANTAEVTNKLLYNKTTTYYLTKAMGALK